jgi:RNA-binding protein YhbY
LAWCCFLASVAGLAPAQNPHLSEALEHAQAAVAQGRQGYSDALVTQAKVALKHAELAKMEFKSPHLEEGIRLLKSAIDQGNQGNWDATTKAVEQAITHLSETNQPTAEAPHGDGY